MMMKRMKRKQRRAEAAAVADVAIAAVVLEDELRLRAFAPAAAPEALPAQVFPASAEPLSSLLPGSASLASTGATIPSQATAPMEPAGGPASLSAPKKKLAAEVASAKVAAKRAANDIAKAAAAAVSQSAAAGDKAATKPSLASILR